MHNKTANLFITSSYLYRQIICIYSDNSPMSVSLLDILSRSVDGTKNMINWFMYFFAESQMDFLKINNTICDPNSVTALFEYTLKGLKRLLIRTRRVQHFWTRTCILITLLIFSRNTFLCLHLEIRISSPPLICIGTSAPDASLSSYLKVSDPDPTGSTAEHKVNPL
jgi:hypothetical protein